MTLVFNKSLALLKVHLAEYRPQLEKAIAAVKTLETATPGSEEFSDALATLHVCATVLEPYSESMVEAVNQFTEDLPQEGE